MPTVTTFRAMFPEFASTPDATIQVWLDASAPFFDVCRWDTWLNLGVSYWVAHQITLAAANALQPIADDTTMQKEDDVSYSRDSQQVNAQANDPYLRTAYGQQYRYYARLVGIGAVAV